MFHGTGIVVMLVAGFIALVVFEVKFTGSLLNQLH
jgi:hypothetical protein